MKSRNLKNNKSCRRLRRRDENNKLSLRLSKSNYRKRRKKLRKRLLMKRDSLKRRLKRRKKRQNDWPRKLKLKPRESD